MSFCAPRDIIATHGIESDETTDKGSNIEKVRLMQTLKAIEVISKLLLLITIQTTNTMSGYIHKSIHQSTQQYP